MYLFGSRFVDKHVHIRVPVSVVTASQFRENSVNGDIAVHSLVNFRKKHGRIAVFHINDLHALIGKTLESVFQLFGKKDG